MSNACVKRWAPQAADRNRAWCGLPLTAQPLARNARDRDLPDHESCFAGGRPEWHTLRWYCCCSWWQGALGWWWQSGRVPFAGAVLASGGAAFLANRAGQSLSALDQGAARRRATRAARAVDDADYRTARALRGE